MQFRVCYVAVEIHSQLRRRARNPQLISAGNVAGGCWESWDRAVASGFAACPALWKSDACMPILRNGSAPPSGWNDRGPMRLRCQLSGLSGMRRWLACRAQRRIRALPRLCPLPNLCRESEDSGNPADHSNSEVEAPRPVLIRGAQLCPSPCSIDLP